MFVSVENSSAVSSVRRRLAASGGGLALVGALMGGCSNTPSRHNTTEPHLFAECDSLKVVVKDAAKRIVELTSAYTVANGAQYVSTTYVFDHNQPSVTVDAHRNPQAHLVHRFPSEPRTQKDEVTAVINYRKPGNPGIFGAIPTAACQVEVHFTAPTQPGEITTNPSVPPNT